ncbi:MAG: methyltransferase, partial [Pseudomonadota bacterium]
HNRVFRDSRRLVDLGGGAGAFAIEALKCHEKLTVTVADRSDVVPLADRAFVSSGLDGRATTLPVDFFTDSLAFDADTISLVRILHDHDDGPVAQLLQNIAKESPGARLAVIEPMADHRRPTGVDAYFPWYFMAMGQGRLRTKEALTALLREAGYRRIAPLKSRNPAMVRGLLAEV